MKKIYAFLLMAAVAAGAMADEFVSDGSGNVYTFNALSQIEGTGVTLQDDGSYLVSANFTISEGDVLQLENNAIIKMANGVQITIDGDADFAPADTAVVTRDAEGSNPKGFWMLGENGNANLMNVTFEYVGVVFGGLNSRLYASPRAEMKEAMFEALIAHGYGDLITRTVNANTLASFCKEQREANKDEIPDWLAEVVNTHDKITVGIRKG